MRAAGVKQSISDISVRDAAHALAGTLGVDGDIVMRYAREDSHGGWDHGDGSFAKGSIWRAEGRLLYGLVRALRPRRVADLGTHAGASATHLAAALEANGRGRVTTVDRGFGHILLLAGDAILREQLADRLVLRSADRILLGEARRRRWQTVELAPRARGARYYRGALVGYRGYRRVLQLPGDLPLPYPGDAIPPALLPRCDVVIGDAARWLMNAPALDFVFEDLDHDRAGTARIARLIERRLAPGGVLVCHDALHPRHGPPVRRALSDAGLRSVVFVRVGDSDCGLAVWRKPGGAAGSGARRPTIG